MFVFFRNEREHKTQRLPEKKDIQHQARVDACSECYYCFALILPPLFIACLIPCQHKYCPDHPFSFLVEQWINLKLQNTP